MQSLKGLFMARKPELPKPWATTSITFSTARNLLNINFTKTADMDTDI